LADTAAWTGIGFSGNQATFALTPALDGIAQNLVPTDTKYHGLT
jgi:hypothetical protein